MVVDLVLFCKVMVDLGGDFDKINSEILVDFVVDYFV